jgi:8-oxo-dGTP diphosphatase
MKPQPPDYKFCPFCGDELQTRQEEGYSRKFCPKDKWTYYPRVATSAGALILDRKKVLLVQRAREPYKGTWMLPSGFSDYAEHPRDTVIRELPEETGYTVKSIEFYDYGQSEDDEREPFHNYFVYKVEVGDKGSITDLEENSAVEWFEINELPPIGWKEHKRILGELREKLNR